LWRPPA